ncbi:MAG: hypothetical protein ACJ8GJ_25535 [Vitreoscilla sp.]
MRPSRIPVAAASCVVANLRSRDEADRSLEALRRAGYAREMLQVIGAHGDVQDVAPLIAANRAAARPRPAPGLSLGVLWAGFVVAITVTPSAGDGRFVVLVVAGVLTLALQAMILARTLRASASGASGAATMGPCRAEGRGDTSAWHYLLLVHGSRSDVALARDILAA